MDQSIQCMQEFEENKTPGIMYWHLAELSCHSIVQTNLLSEFLMNAANINDEATSNNNDWNVNNSLVKL